ncbi:MAG TPA: hypothetical protein PLB18_04340 [Acidobacteriota bacterium]|nr:hypothetical protein [Acidobacteriota bacterium]
MIAYRRRHKIRGNGKGWWVGIKTPSGWKALAGPYRTFLEAVEHTETRECNPTSAHGED